MGHHSRGESGRRGRPEGDRGDRGRGAGLLLRGRPARRTSTRWPSSRTAPCWASTGRPTSPTGRATRRSSTSAPGNTGFRTWSTGHGRIGVGICWDQWFPEAARAMALQGADLLALPDGHRQRGGEPGRQRHRRHVATGHGRARRVQPRAGGRGQPDRERGRAHLLRVVLHRRPPGPTAGPGRPGHRPRPSMPSSTSTGPRPTAPVGGCSAIGGPTSTVVSRRRRREPPTRRLGLRALRHLLGRLGGCRRQRRAGPAPDQRWIRPPPLARPRGCGDVQRGGRDPVPAVRDREGARDSPAGLVGVPDAGRRRPGSGGPRATHHRHGGDGGAHRHRHQRGGHRCPGRSAGAAGGVSRPLQRRCGGGGDRDRRPPRGRGLVALAVARGGTGRPRNGRGVPQGPAPGRRTR